MAKKIQGNVGKYGARYGKSTRDKVAKSENLVRSSKKSPFCNKNTVKRVSSGLWFCKKTGIKFTGKAYTFDSKSFSSAGVKSQEVYIDMSPNEESASPTEK